jgi:hypothetical protein
MLLSQFSAIFGKTIGDFLNVVMFFHNLALFCAKTPFFTPMFLAKIFKKS